MDHINKPSFKKILGICLLLFLSKWTIAAPNNLQPALLQIASHELPPYHWLNKENKLVGPALTPLQCIFGELKQAIEITVFPWARAQEFVRQKRLDAFFIVSRNEKRDQYAEFATPFYFDKWYFYYHRDKSYSLLEDDIKDRYVGVLLGSNMENWLKTKGFSKLLSGRGYEHLFKILHLERLEIVMATEGIYRTQMEQLGWDENHFAAEKIRDLDMGIYFGRHFIEAYPGYIQRFNDAALNCIEQNSSVSN